MMKPVSIRQILLHPDEIPPSWLYLPPDDSSWSLDTLGVFEDSDKDFEPESDDYIPDEAKKNNWIEILDGQTIQSIYANASSQLENKLTPEDLFKAFKYYVTNDAFLEFQ